MNTSKDTIAAGLEEVFWSKGFAVPSVPDLGRGAGVSLRTLYKYFPSREEMVIGALDFRHNRYLKLIQEDMPDEPEEAVDQLMDRLGWWMENTAGKGCLFLQARATFPDSTAIAETVRRHKDEIVSALCRIAGSEERGVRLHVLHEGLTASYAAHGPRAVAEAKMMARGVLRAH